MNELTAENDAKTITLWRCCSIYLAQCQTYESNLHLAFRNEILEVNLVKL
jgi:hypothetical protein